MDSLTETFSIVPVNYTDHGSLPNTTIDFVFGSEQNYSFNFSIVRWFVVVTGCIGCLATGSVFFLFISDEQLLKFSSPFLIKFQICIDFVSCIILVISYAMKLVLNGNGETMKRWGSIVCMLFIGDGLVYTALYSTTTNLGVIAFERYMKIVHAVKHMKYFRK